MHTLTRIFEGVLVRLAEGVPAREGWERGCH